MNVVELFAGTQSLSKVARSLGHQTFTSDFDSSFNTDYTIDVMEYDITKIPFEFVDFIWASPPCETFSVASIGHHWTGGKGAYLPKTKECLNGIKRVGKTLQIIEDVNPKFWVIENPRGVLRKMPFMEDYRRVTVTYCQYGDSRMKPTDLWTNIPEELWNPRPMCKNGSPCHIAAPRGSSTGTQGIKTYKDRSRVPSELCKEILEGISGSRK